MLFSLQMSHFKQCPVIYAQKNVLINTEMHKFVHFKARGTVTNVQSDPLETAASPSNFCLKHMASVRVKVSKYHSGML